MNKRFYGKVVLVTGGTGKLGQYLVNSFLDEGATIIFTSRSLKRASACSKSRANVYPFKCDLLVSNDIKSLKDFVYKRFKRIDIIVNNAAVDIDMPLISVKDYQFEKLIRTNLMGPYYVCKYLIRMMVKQKRGKVINVSSILSQKTVKNATEYSMSKAALDSLTRSLAIEYGKYNININSVNIGVMPGMLNRVDEVVEQRSIDEKAYSDWSIKKCRIPLRRRGNYSEYVNTILFLASEESDFINGASIPVDGGVLAGL
jgi:NAD(P)-dependent dehydrogenase (short-subunit alcohol dehydrogenase family)